MAFTAEDYGESWASLMGCEHIKLQRIQVLPQPLRAHETPRSPLGVVAACGQATAAAVDGGRGTAAVFLTFTGGVPGCSDYHSYNAHMRTWSLARPKPRQLPPPSGCPARVSPPSQEGWPALGSDNVPSINGTDIRAHQGSRAFEFAPETLL